MKVLTMIPYDLDANLGRAYNEAMALLPSDGWAIFQDHDAIPSTGQWFRQFVEAIEFRPDAGAIVAMTNRIAAPWQRCGDPLSNDYALHRRFGEQRAKVRTLLDISATKGWGGVAFALSKEAWSEVGGFVEGGLGCTDHSIHYRLRAAGRKVWMAENIYYMHWRHWQESDPTSQFPKAPNCPCRGPEVLPSARIHLP